MTPRGAISGIHRRKRDDNQANTIDRPSKTIPPAESNFSGVLLNEKMPRFAHSRFFKRLFVLSPNIALWPDIVDAGLAEADVSPQSAQKQIPLRATQ